MNKFYYFIYLVLIFQSAFSQITYKGHITDSLNNPVVGANVLLKTEGDGKILSYTSSDTNGFYSIEVDQPGSYILYYTSLSFKSQSKAIQVKDPDLASSKEYENNVTLENTDILLQEVVVNANVPVVVKNDTIDIKVESFLTGNEEVAEDVIKNLPGIDVDSDGNIRVQGKSVEKVLIEGDDLFEKGYKLLTKNLDAGTIDKIQILQNYSDNPLLKNISNSDNVALNISLKEDVKNTLFGKGTLGLGIESIYEAKANIINVQKRNKLYFFGNLNNRGVDATGDIYQLINPDFLSSENYIGDGETAKPIVNGLMNTPPLSNERYNFNNAELATLSTIFNPTDNIKIKSILFYSGDENNFFQREIENFETDSLAFTNEEINRVRRYSKLGSGKFELTYKPHKNNQLDMVSKLSYGEFVNNNQLTFNRDSNRINISENVLFLDNRITYTAKLDSVTAVQLSARLIHDRKPQDFNFSGFLYENIFPEVGEVSNTTQTLQNELNFAGIELSYLTSLENKSPLRIDVGYFNRYSKLANELIFFRNNEEILVSEEFENLVTNRFQRLYTKFNFRFAYNKFSFRSNVKFLFDTNEIVQPGSQNRESIFNVIPRIEIAYAIDKKNKILSSYQYTLNSLELNDIYQNYILTNYREFKRGLGRFEQLRGNYYLLSYIHGDWSDSFLINTSMIYSNDVQYLGFSSDINANNSLVSSNLFDDKNFLSFNLNADRFISPLSLNFKVKGSLSYTSFENIVNSQLRRIRSTTYKFGPEIRSVFLSGINFHVGTEWTISEFRTSVSTQNISNVSFLDVSYQINDRIFLESSNELYSFQNLEPNGYFLFSDLNINYKLGNDLKLYLKINNIWNTSSFDSFSLVDTGSYLNQFELLPRYMQLSLDFRF